jgi:predicted transcriptional regulator
MEKNDLIYDGVPKDTLSDSEKRLMALINGDKPRDANEEAIVRDIENDRKKGYILDIPSN